MEFPSEVRQTVHVEGEEHGFQSALTRRLMAHLYVPLHVGGVVQEARRLVVIPVGERMFVADGC